MGTINLIAELHEEVLLHSLILSTSTGQVTFSRGQKMLNKSIAYTYM